MITKTEFKKIVIENPKGFTISLNGDSVKSGYAVSFSNRENYRNLDLNINFLFKSLKRDFKNLGDSLKLGGFVNAKGFYIIDFSLIEKSKKNALFLAERFNQEGIYNISKQKYIPNSKFKSNQTYS